MNPTRLAAILVSTALLMGCSEAGPFDPPGSAATSNAGDYDWILPPPSAGDPVQPLPPIDDEGGSQGQRSLSPATANDDDTVSPEPPLPADPPVKPLPPVEGGSEKNDRGSSRS